MPLYPTIEDMKVSEMAQAQLSATHTVITGQTSHASSNNDVGLPYDVNPAQISSLYPALEEEYMGFNIREAKAMYGWAVAPVSGGQVAPSYSSGSQMVAPVTGSDLGQVRAEIKGGMRPVTICKDGKGRIGCRFKDVNTGVFIQFVEKDSAAALGGLRFGDQVLSINDQVVAGMSQDKIHSLVKKLPVNNIKIVVRDRPFERTITIVKDNHGFVGFQFRNGMITDIVKDSSAARNGVLTEHQILEVNGQNIVGLDDKALRKIIEGINGPVTFTVMPKVLFEHMVKSMGGGLVSKMMDHSIPPV